MRNTILSFLLAGFALQAQEGRISGPVAATFFDEATSSVRAINGVPGAGYLSEALASADSAAVSPDGRYVLLSAQQRIVSIDLAGGATQFVSEGEASKIAWSADSAAAAFVRNGSLNLWKRDGNLLREVGAAPASVTRMAVDAAAEAVFTAAANGIARHHDGEAAMVLAPVADAAGLVLSADGKSLYTVSRSEHQVLEIDAHNGGAGLFARDAANPVGVALTRDGSLLVADAESRSVLRYSRSSRALLATLELSFSPARLDTIGDGVYLLNQRSKQEPLEVVAVQPSLAAFFVPAPQEN
ncbi:MAG: hypothetical protein JNK48_24700 [Bryobacterales bacterium]|nr:hypothetical protein [Bryobacterales bacterium]